MGKVLTDSLNHPVVFVNPRFEEILGYTLKDIPDKNTWWKTAYPDPAYQKVVEAQWELLFQEALEQGKSYVSLEVDIQTKRNGIKRFKVYAEVESETLPEHYVVIFTKPDSTN